jgi:hypothetical protein
VFAQVWIGSGNIDPNLSTFLLNVDTRFPQYKQPADISGLTLDANTFASFDFTLHVPRTVDRANYFIQSCLMQAHWFDVGTYFDRGMVVLNVT